jgi:hypothetical protein
MRWYATPDRRLLAASILLQLALAPLLGHSWDTKIFMATGYLVGTGQTPYLAQNLAAVFHHTGFGVISSVGYPPPWPLVLGLLYRGVHAVTANLIVYNVAIKLPLICADIALAYLVAAMLTSVGAESATARRAWVFLLFNPFLLYVSAAWGQIDVLVALLAVAALAALNGRRVAGSAVLLALTVCFKPIAAPIALVALVYLLGRSRGQAARYAAVFVVAVLAFYVAPFFAFGWSRAPFLLRLNDHFVMNGTMSLTTVARLFRDPLLMTGRWWLLGLLWIPALAVGVVALRRGVGGFDDLVKKSTALVLIFFLTRTWLSEPNIVLVVPLALILTSLGELDRRALTALWVIPLAFTVFNASPLQLLWVAFPDAMQRSLTFVAQYGHATLVARAALVIAWQIAGWWVVVACFRESRRQAAETGLARRAQAPATGGGVSWS